MNETPKGSAHVNIGKKDRMASMIGGGALALFGLSKRSVGGTLAALLGGTLIYRGMTGHCDVCAALGKTQNEETFGGAHSQSREIPGHGGVLVHKVVTINKPADELYAFWRKLENLPRFMNHLESVEETDATHSHWVAKAPAGTSVSWDAEIIRDNPSELIAWRSTPDSTIPNSGSVRFVSKGSETEVKVNLEYQPPGGTIGALFAKLFGEEPQQQVNEDLLRFKQLMETGEITTNGREDSPEGK